MLLPELVSAQHCLRAQGALARAGAVRTRPLQCLGPAPQMKGRAGLLAEIAHHAAALVGRAYVHPFNGPTIQAL